MDGNTSPVIREGMDLLAMFTPSQIDAICRTAAQYGSATSQKVERHRKENLIAGPALGFLSGEHITSDIRVPLQRSLTLIIRDAMVSQWTEAEYVKMLVQATGCSTSVAEDVVRTGAVITNEDWAVTQWLTDGVLGKLTLGLPGVALQLVDDLFDKWTEKGAADNLYEWMRLGRAVGDMTQRAILTRHEIMYENSGATSISQLVGQHKPTLQLAEAGEPAWTPEGVVAKKRELAKMLTTLAALLDELNASAVEGKHPETGEPFTALEAEPLQKELSELLREGVTALKYQAHPDAEQGGFLGNLIGKVGKKVFGGIKKGFKKLGKKVRKRVQKRVLRKHGGSRKRINSLPEAKQALRSLSSTRTSAPSGKDIEIIIRGG